MERNTYQKRAVLTVLAQLQGKHPTADDVVRHVQTIIPEISRATVYRILTQITEQGGLRRIPIPVSADRYDQRTDKHCHMRCEKCGAVMDVDVKMPDIEALYKNLPSDTAYVITGYELLFTGYCTCCGQPSDL